MEAFAEIVLVKCESLYDPSRRDEEHQRWIDFEAIPELFLVPDFASKAQHLIKANYAVSTQLKETNTEGYWIQKMANLMLGKLCYVARRSDLAMQLQLYEVGMKLSSMHPEVLFFHGNALLRPIIHDMEEWLAGIQGPRVDRDALCFQAKQGLDRLLEGERLSKTSRLKKLEKSPIVAYTVAYSAIFLNTEADGRYSRKFISDNCRIALADHAKRLTNVNHKRERMASLLSYCEEPSDGDTWIFNPAGSPQSSGSLLQSSGSGSGSDPEGSWIAPAPPAAKSYAAAAAEGSTETHAAAVVAPQPAATPRPSAALVAPEDEAPEDEIVLAPIQAAPISLQDEITAAVQMLLCLRRAEDAQIVMIVEQRFGSEEKKVFRENIMQACEIARSNNYTL